MKTPSYYEPDLNPTYRDLAEHYGTAIIPARPCPPRDKVKVEVAVQVVQRCRAPPSQILLAERG